MNTEEDEEGDDKMRVRRRRERTRQETQTRPWEPRDARPRAPAAHTGSVFMARTPAGKSDSAACLYLDPLKSRREED